MSQGFCISSFEVLALDPEDGDSRSPPAATKPSIARWNAAGIIAAAASTRARRSGA